MLTIVIATILVIVGVLGTFATVIPERPAVYAYIVAGILMLLGLFFRGI